MLMDCKDQNQPPRGVLRKGCSGNTRQIYSTVPKQKCEFIKVALKLY